jgi:hypothetical protein
VDLLALDRPRAQQIEQESRDAGIFIGDLERAFELTNRLSEGRRCRRGYDDPRRVVTEGNSRSA